MSVNSKRINFSFKNRLKSSLFATLIATIIGLLLAFAMSFLLMLSGTPEKFYDIASIALLILSSFITGRVWINRQSNSKLLDVVLFSVFLFVFLTLLSLLFSASNLSFASLPVTFLAILFSTMLSMLFNVKKKTKKMRKKRN